MEARRRGTPVVTRAYSGRPARGPQSTIIERLEGRGEIILHYPLQNALTRAMRTRQDGAAMPSIFHYERGEERRSREACLLASWCGGWWKK